MTPIGALAREHRLIERMMCQMAAGVEKMSEEVGLDASFIDTAVDFFQTFTDRCHHGKEEDILFRALGEKDISAGDQKTMGHLVEQHVFARKQVGQLLLDKERCVRGDADALKAVAATTTRLIQFYPTHARTEETAFFPAAAEYLSEAEQEEVLRKFGEFDQKLIHEKYRLVIEDLERRGATRE